MRCSRVYGPAPRSKLEFDYSLRRKSPDKMIACVMEPACFDTSLWHGAVGMTLGGRLYIDLSKDDDAGFLAGIKKLVDEICKVTDALPPVGDLTLGASPPARLSAYPDLAFTRYAAQKLFHQISLDFPGTQLVREEPYIFLVPDLLTATECDQLIVKLACAEEQQASGNAQQVASGARTSMTAFARNDELPTLRQRLAKLANVAVEQLQPTKLTRYDKGQRFATHTDAMDPPQDWGVAYKQVWEAPARYPNRMVTIFVYLNDCARGGRTCWRSFESPDLYSDRFPKLAERLGLAAGTAVAPGLSPNQVQELCVTPQRGLAVVHFPCTTLELAGMPDTNAVHEAEEVVDRKFILQQFVWSAAVDPNDEGVHERVREAFQQRLNEQPEKVLSATVM